MDSPVIFCESCGSQLKYYDRVPRHILGKNRVRKSVSVERFRCPKCGSIHRKLPSYILPYKQYDAEIIRGVIEGFITSRTFGYEDYPCELTMIRWQTSHDLHLLL